MNPSMFLWVFLGGGLGSMARFGVTLIIRNGFSTQLPLATFISNLFSCILLALVAGPLAGKAPEGSVLKIFLIAGFCGGFSTFSTFSYETLELMRSGQIVAAVANILLSTALCILVIYLLTKQS